MLEKIIFMFILFVANVIQTITGFAGNLIAMPVSIQVVGIDSAKAVINIVTLVACLYLSIVYRRNINWKILKRILLGMILGMIVGVWLFPYFSVEIWIRIYGILILCIAMKKICIKKEVNLPKAISILVIFLAGIIHGMFLSGGALLVIYAVTVLKDKKEFRATIAPVWVVMDGLLIYNHYELGYYTYENLVLIVVSMIPLILSVWIGNLLFQRINREVFLNVTYFLLILSGISAII